MALHYTLFKGPVCRIWWHFAVRFILFHICLETTQNVLAVCHSFIGGNIEEPKEGYPP